MKRLIPHPLPDNPRNLMRRANYGEHTGHEGQVSYVRRLSGADYPRFHVYLEESARGLSINIHVDQKRPSYQGSHAHSGEYDGPMVEQELDRIVSTFGAAPSAPPAPSEAPEEKKGFWGTLFG
jgi:hypothetical protein